MLRSAVERDLLATVVFLDRSAYDTISRAAVLVSDSHAIQTTLRSYVAITLELVLFRQYFVYKAMSIVVCQDYEIIPMHQ